MNEVGHVYKALGEILKSLSVAKTGVLPGSMGGKPYITAVEATAEVKRQFVEHGLIIIPNETVVEHENIVTADRAVKITIVTRGEYTIVSTLDGSSVTVSGVGDGLANGTAVASNIASTNAIKNALLRTFLITEQSVEDEAKNGAAPVVDKPSKAAAAISRARNVTMTTSDVQAKIREWIGSDDGRREAVNTKMGELKMSGISGPAVYEALAQEFLGSRNA